MSRISVRDDGRGIAPDNLQKMLGLGFSTARQDEVGQYGEGFKSSTMKLAKDVLVLSQKRYKSDDNKKVYGRTVGFLSQTLHEADKLEYMHTPYLYLKKDADEFEWADVTALLVGSLGDTTCAEQQQAEAAANRRMIARYAFDHLRQKFSPSMPRAMTDDERVAQLDAALSPAFEELFGEEGTGAHIDMFNVTPELLRVIRADESTGVTSPWVDCKGAPASREAGMPGDVRFLCEEPNDGYLYNTSLMEYLGTVYSFASVWPSTQTERSKQFAIHVNGVQVRRHCWDRLLYTGDDQKPTKLEYKPAVGSCDPDSLGEQLRAKEIDRLNLLCGHNARFAEQPGASRNTHEGPRFRPFGLLICVAGRVVDVFNHAHINRKAWQKNAAPERQQASLGSCILVELPKGMKGFITNTNKDGAAPEALLAYRCRSQGFSPPMPWETLKRNSARNSSISARMSPMNVLNWSSTMLESSTHKRALSASENPLGRRLHGIMHKAGCLLLNHPCRQIVIQIARRRPAVARLLIATTQREPCGAGSFVGHLRH